MLKKLLDLRKERNFTVILSRSGETFLHSAVNLIISFDYVKRERTWKGKSFRVVKHIYKSFGCK